MPTTQNSSLRDRLPTDGGFACFAAAVLLIVFVFSASAAFAQNKSKNKSKGSQADRKNVENARKQVADLQDKAAQAKKRVDRSKADMNAARRALSETAAARNRAHGAMVQTRAEYSAALGAAAETAEADPRLRAVAASLVEAENKMQAARESALRPLTRDATYRDKVAARQQLRRHIDELKAGGELKQRELQEQVTAELALDSAINQLELEFIEGDVAYQQARKQFVDANLELSRLRKQAGQSIQDDPDRRSAADRVEDARQRYIDAEAEYDKAAEALRRRRDAYEQAQADAAKVDKQLADAQTVLKNLQRLNSGKKKAKKNKSR